MTCYVLFLPLSFSFSRLKGTEKKEKSMTWEKGKNIASSIDMHVFDVKKNVINNDDCCYVYVYTIIFCCSC